MTFGSEVSRHEEVEKRPEFKDVVLDWSATQDETVVALQLLHRTRQLRLAVPNDVTFVKDDEVPLDLREEIDVVANDFV